MEKIIFYEDIPSSQRKKRHIEIRNDKKTESRRVDENWKNWPFLKKIGLFL